MSIDREEIKRRALEAIDLASDEDLARGRRDREYAHDWLQKTIGFIANLVSIISVVFKGCYISTAAANYLGWSDKSDEMMELRRFRDHYILSNSESTNHSDLELYYFYSPLLIEWIDSRYDSAFIWPVVGRAVIELIESIRKNDFEEAYRNFRDHLLALRRNMALRI